MNGFNITKCAPEPAVSVFSFLQFRFIDRMFMKAERKCRIYHFFNVFYINIYCYSTYLLLQLFK